MPPERLHRAGIVVYALATLREAAIPLIAIFAVSVLGGGFDERSIVRAVGFAIAGAAFAAAAGYVRWMTTRWWVSDDGGIHHRSGVISTKAVDVPLSRVQSLDLEQGPVQRLFGVQALHVQTGGGGARGEIVLDAVGPDVVRALRDLLAERPAAPTPGPATAAPEPRERVAERRLDRSRLLLAALTAGQFSVILPILAVLGQLGESLFDPERGREAVGLLPESTGGWVIAVAVLAIAAWLLSVAGTVVAFAGFTAGRDGDRLRIRRGLLARREATVPVERIRAIAIVEGVLRRPLGLASLRLEVIGHADEPAAAQTLFPLLRRAEVRPFLDRLLPELADDPAGLEPPPRRALRRYALPPALAGLAAGAAAWPLTGLGPWALLAAVPAAGYGAARYRAAGWRLSDGRLAVRSLLLARTTVLAPAANRESHAIEQTVLQRHGDLADLEVAFGKSTTARIRHLDAAVAGDAFRLLE
jgi:putative membrane protein